MIRFFSLKNAENSLTKGTWCNILYHSISWFGCYDNRKVAKGCVRITDLNDVTGQ